jgi:hypothetical protein
MTVVFFVAGIAKLPITFCGIVPLHWMFGVNVEARYRNDFERSKLFRVGGKYDEILAERRYRAVCDGSSEDMETKKRGGSRGIVHPPLRDSETSDRVVSEIP